MRCATAIACLFTALSLCSRTAEAFTPDGKKLVVAIKGLDSAALIGVDRITSMQEPITSSGFLQNPTDVVVDGGLAIVADADAGGLITVNLFTGEQSFLEVGILTCWIALNDNVIYGAGPAGLSKIDPVTGESTRLSPIGGALQNPFDIIMGEDAWAGQLLVADPDAGGVFSVNPDTGEASAVGNGTLATCWLATDTSGRTLYATSADGLFVFNPTTDEFDPILSASSGQTFGAIEGLPDGHIALNIMSDGADDGVYNVDPATGDMSPIAAGELILGPTGVAAVVIPEPASLALLGLGGIALMLRRRCST